MGINRYRQQVTAAVTFARGDYHYRAYRARGWYFAANMRLAERWGTWVAHDAQKAMGHTM